MREKKSNELRNINGKNVIEGWKVKRQLIRGLGEKEKRKKHEKKIKEENGILKKEREKTEKKSLEINERINKKKFK